MVSDSDRRQLRPVQPGERIVLLDVLRGFAMFGVLWSNLNEAFGAHRVAGRWQEGLHWIQSSLIEFRFYSLLGFLFGIGFAVQLGRAEARGTDGGRLFARRMAVLLAIGMAHGMLIWHGDVLTEYALVGMLLLAYRRVPTRWLPAAAAVTWLGLPHVVNAVLAATGAQLPPAPSREAVDAIYMHGTAAQIVAQEVRAYIWFYQRWLLFITPSFLTLFVLGMWAVRVDLVKRVTARRRRLAGVMAGGAVVAVAARALPDWTGASRELTIWANAAVYAAAVALAFSLAAARRWMMPLAAVGRMSLTTYLTQSVIAVVLFYAYGLGWYGRVGLAGMLGLTLVIFGAQVAGSVWWLGRFRFGPVEWVWRRAVYGRERESV